MTTTQLLTSALAGLGLGLGLIVAIGAQNAFVLRQGINHEHVGAVVLVCIVSDALLITAGVGGAGAVFSAVPWLVDVARWGGAAFLLAYGWLAARRAWRRPGMGGSGLQVGGEEEAPRGVPVTPSAVGGAAPARASRAAATLERAPAATATVNGQRRLAPVLATTLALTWLNPHVYLDTVVVLGSVGSTHGAGRWAFAAGAVTGSVVWFTALGLAARVLSPVFARPAAWRVLDGAIALVMTGMAVGLVAGA